MKIQVPIVLGSFVLATLVQTHADVVLLSDNFDGYADQTAFEAAWPVVGAQPSATLSTAQFVSSPNSVNVSAATNTATSQRNGRSFSESGNPAAANVITFSFDFFDSNAALQPYRQYANLQDGTAPGSFGQLVSMGLNNNQISTANGGNFYMARILGYTPSDTGGTSGSYFKLNEVGAPLRSTGWHNLAVTISDVDFKFYVDGILSETVAQSTLRSYDVVRLGAGVSSTAEAFFDNVNIATVVPEPSTVALSVLGGVALCFMLIRRRK